MAETIIKVEGLGKRYLIGHERAESYTTLRDRITNNVKGFGKNIKKMLATDGSNSIAGDQLEEFWALKDLNFEIKRGEAVGIVGSNGAGKSTLLKVLSRITEPTLGQIEIKGRMASLLEVGTGFHPELSGRENIYLNGAILGMSRAEVKRKFDEIVDFSGVEKFLDTPVKRYSSGMYVRLAFAVAAHLESEILIVDEVLAVGDAEFQKKCLGKMGEVTKEDGRTVLFVSHNMGAINDLCSSAILLKNGTVFNRGSTREIVKEYFKSPVKISSSTNLNDYKSRRGNGEIRFDVITIGPDNVELDPTKEILINFRLKAFADVLGGVYFYLGVKDPITGSAITDSGYIPLLQDTLIAGSNPAFSLIIQPNLFRTGVFPLYFWLGKDIRKQDYPFDVVDNLFFLNVVSTMDSSILGYNAVNPNGTFNMNPRIEMIK